MYEHSLEEIIKFTLEDAYSLKDEKLEEYLITRYMLLNKITKIDKVNTSMFSNFICDLLYIRIIDGRIKYYDTWVSVNSYLEESIICIIENWNVFSRINKAFRASNNEKSVISQIEKFCEKTVLAGKRKSNKISGIYKKYYYDNYVLEQLNSTYDIQPIFPKIPKEIGPVKEKVMSERTYEEICKAYVSAMLFDTYENKLVSEKDIENFIYKNYQKYFKDTKMVGKQVKIDSGYIADIVLSDETTDYIVEIKNKKDDRLYWQAVNYYNLQKKKTLKNVKIITIAPEYSDEMISSLRTLSYTEIKTFSLKIENGKIVELNIIDI